MHLRTPGFRLPGHGSGSSRRVLRRAPPSCGYHETATFGRKPVWQFTGVCHFGHGLGGFTANFVHLCGSFVRAWRCRFFFCRGISMCRARAPGSAAVVRLCIILVVQCGANNGAWCGGAREANCLELEAGGEVAPRPPRRRVADGGCSRTHVPTPPRLSFGPSSAAARFTREITRVPIIHATTATSARNDQRQPGGPISRARRAIRTRLALLRWRGE